MTPYIADRASWNDAAGLIDSFGEQAGLEAAARADRSRQNGNLRSFCRWRQIERLIDQLALAAPAGPLH